MPSSGMAEPASYVPPGPPRPQAKSHPSSPSRDELPEDEVEQVGLVRVLGVATPFTCQPDHLVAVVMADKPNQATRRY